MPSFECRTRRARSRRPRSRCWRASSPNRARRRGRCDHPEWEDGDRCAVQRGRARRLGGRRRARRRRGAGPKHFIVDVIVLQGLFEGERRATTWRVTTRLSAPRGVPGRPDAGDPRLGAGARGARRIVGRGRDDGLGARRGGVHQPRARRGRAGRDQQRSGRGGEGEGGKGREEGEARGGGGGEGRAGEGAGRGRRYDRTRQRR